MTEKNTDYEDYMLIDFRAISLIILDSWKLLVLIIMISIFIGYQISETVLKINITKVTIKKNKTKFDNLVIDLNKLSKSINYDLWELKKQISFSMGNEIASISKFTPNNNFELLQTIDLDNYFNELIFLNTYIEVMNNKDLILSELLKDDKNLKYSLGVIDKKKLKNFVNNINISKNNDKTYVLSYRSKDTYRDNFIINKILKNTINISMNKLESSFGKVEDYFVYKKTTINELINKKFSLIEDEVRLRNEKKLEELQAQKKIIDIKIQFVKEGLTKLKNEKNNFFINNEKNYQKMKLNSFLRIEDLEKNKKIINLKIQNIKNQDDNNNKILEPEYLVTKFQRTIFNNLVLDMKLFLSKSKQLITTLNDSNEILLRNEIVSKRLYKSMFIIGLFAIIGFILGIISLIFKSMYLKNYKKAKLKI